MWLSFNHSDELIVGFERCDLQAICPAKAQTYDVVKLSTDNALEFLSSVDSRKQVFRCLLCIYHCGIL